MPLPPHSAAWYDRLATLQQGYSYPWRSYLEPFHGEDVYRALIRQHLQPDMDVLDIGCAQGETALEIAPYCRSVVGYDRIAAWIRLAQQVAQERGITNTTFICHDSSAEANGGRVRLPVTASAFDLLICSKGPVHWIEDLRRVARPGANAVHACNRCTPTHGLDRTASRAPTLAGERPTLGAAGV